MMNKDLLIEEELKEEINSLILEELTVNDEVLKTSLMALLASFSGKYYGRRSLKDVNKIRMIIEINKPR